MRTVFADEAPLLEIRGGNVTLTFEGEKHPTVVVPIHVMRKFCETGIRLLDAHDEKPSNVRYMANRDH